MAEVQQHVETKGSSNRIVTAGRDINFFQGEPDFVTPDLEPYAPPRYPTHRITPRLVKALENERLVLLGGDSRIDKTSLARHLARSLISRLGTDAASVAEWRRGSALPNLVGAIRGTGDRTVFLLIDLTPQDLQGGPSRIHEVAGRQHYVIATTKADKHAWRLEPHEEEGFWQDLQVEQVYDTALLANKLRALLLGRRDTLPAPFKGFTSMEAAIIGALSLQDIATGLQTPNQIDIFVRLLQREADPVDERRLKALIGTATDPSSIVRQSYRELRSANERLTALAFSMFDGLTDDQVFAAVERLYQDAWRARKPDLAIPDYCDVDFLRETLFDFTETENGATLVEPRFADQRKILFEVAWGIDRRQMLRALPVLTKLVAESVEQNAGNRERELFGRPEQRRRLRDAVAETLSDVGRQSCAAVEDRLMSMAASENVGVQSVAARAMARWREYGMDDQLFAQLKRWHEDADAARALRILIESWQSQLTAQPEDYLRATVALTLGYAAQYDSNNALEQDLIDRLVAFADDTSPVVRRAFRAGTLPLIIRSHAVQLKDQLREMTADLDLIDPIAQSLELTYRSEPAATMDILDDWYRDAIARPPSQLDALEHIERETLLATVVLAYALINVEPVHADIVTERLKFVLSTERHPIVREGMLIAITRLAKRDFSHFSDMLRQIIDGMRHEDADVIADALTAIFIDERAKLPSGDGELEHLGRLFPVWLDRDRPLTGIEETLLSWLGADDSAEHAKELVLKCWLRFEDLFHEPEQARIRELREARLQQDSGEDDEDAPVLSFERAPTPPVSWSAKWVAFFSREDYSTLRGLLSQALVYKDKGEVLDAVLERWEDHSNPEASRLAGLLRKTLKHRSWLRS